MDATTSNLIAPSPSETGGRAAVLLVDDRRENLLAMAAALEPLGVELVSATSSSEALRHVGTRDFAVILLDVQMPEMDGYEVARRIKAMDRPHVAPIVFVTALDRDRRALTAWYESGAVDYLFKPLDLDVLRTKVAAFVRLWEEREAEAVRERRRYADLARTAAAEAALAVTAASAEAREAAGRRATQLLARIGDAHFTLDRAYRILAVNPAAERLLAKSHDQLVGRVQWDVFPASATNDAGRAYRRVVEEGVDQHLTQHYAAEGYDIHVEIDAYPTDEGGAAIFLRDITQHVRDRTALAAFQTVVEQAADAHAFFDEAGRILWANRTMTERLGYTPDALRERHVWDIAPLYTAESYAALFARARGGRVEPFESEHRRRDGTTFPVEVAATVVRLPEGERLFSAVRDISERKAAQAELEAANRRLAESEARYRSLFDSIDEGFAVIEMLFDDDGRPVDYRFVETNAAFLQQSGLADAVGHTARELVPALEEHWTATYGRVAITGEPTRFELGSEAMRRWFDVFAFRAGRPEERRVALLFRDVSAAKAAERERERLHRELELERSRLEYVFRRAPSFLAVLRGPDHVFTLANDAYYQLVGHRDVVGKPVWEALPEVRGQGFEALLDHVRETGEPYVGRELALRVQRTPDGPLEERHVDLTYLPLVEADGEPTGIIAHGTDVTEQVRARREVERARDRADRLQRLTAALAAATTAAEVAEVVVSQGVAATAAETGLFALREPGPEGGGTIVRHVGVEPAIAAEYARVPADAKGPLAEVLRTGAPIFVESREELRSRFPDLPQMWEALGTHAMATVPLDAGGETLGAMSIGYTAPRTLPPEERDFFMALGRQAAHALERARLLAAERAALAEAERAEAEAVEARAQAEEASQAKSAFLATMSHELRTPINAMIGYTQLLELGIAGPLTDQQRDYLGRLTRSSEHLLTLINDILDISKIEAGELSARRDDAWTGPSVDAALDLTRPLADARAVALEDDRPGPQGVPFVGDEQRVRQILVNLLSNAVKFTEPAGLITVSCGTAAEAGRTARLHGHGPWTWVRVADSGIGIAPEQLARIFEAFHQVDASHTRTTGGTGLGLAISRRLARLMGGDLTAESEVGRGSTFTLWLPAAGVEGPAESAAARRSRAAPGGGAASAAGELSGLGQVGEALRASLEPIIESYVERLRADPELPVAREMSVPELEDHHVTLLSDLAQSLVIIGAAGTDAPALLRDGSAIQRTISEYHGLRRRHQGWSEAALRRGYDVLRAEVERAVRRQLRASGATEAAVVACDEAVRVLLGLLENSEGESVRAWRRSQRAAGED